MPHISIIGSGLGGLAAALYLRRFGFAVSVFEKNERTGGKARALWCDRSQFDLGPTVLTMPFILQDLLRTFSSAVDDAIELLPVEPTCRYHWSDGTVFDAFSDADKRREEMLKAFPQDAIAFETFLESAGELYEMTKDVFLFGQFNGVKELLDPSNLRSLSKLPRLGLGTTVHRSLARRFQSPHLVQLLDRYATYTGSSPYKAPATLNVIPFVELAFGAWYPKGGMNTIAETLTAGAHHIGIDIRTGANVRRFVREGNRITSVVVDESVVQTDAVISTVDALWTYRSLLEPVGIRTPRTVRNAERSSSGFLILAVVRGHSKLAHHNIFFSDDYPNEFRDIFERKRLPRHMTIYVSISSKSDADLAMPGHENWYLLVNAPAGGEAHTDHVAHEVYAESVWARLREFGLNPEIVSQRLQTPHDIEIRDNSPGGALYGASSNSMFSAFTRPRNRVPGLENLYVAGGSVHPGGGVPLVILSGKIVSQIIAQDFGLTG